jgi:tetratricopeptide (TPR) repeat protein
VVSLFQTEDAKTRLKGKTTTQVCEEFVKPVTKEFKSSFCELLSYRNSPEVAVATVFISHAWKYQFLDVLDAIVEYFTKVEADFESVILWFDLFCNNQHKAVEFDFHWWCNTFLSAIREINHTVMIFAPWNDPIPLTRAWCVWELYCTISTDSKFSVALSQEQQNLFLKDIWQHPDQVIKRMLATIDSKNSSAFISADQERIHEVVRSTIGFSALNGLIFEKMGEWIVWTAEKEFVDHKKTPNERSEIHQALVKLYHLQGNLARARRSAVECVEECEQLYGKDHSNSLTARNDLATILFDLHEIAEAEQMYRDILQILENPEVFQSMPNAAGFKATTLNNIAGCCLETAKYEEAEQFYLLALEHHETVSKTDPYNYLSSLSNLSCVYMNRGRYDQAEPLFLKTLALQREKLGDNHLDTLNTMNLLSVTLKYQGKLDEAAPLCQECFQRRRTVLGPEHIHTLESMVGLATLCMRQSRDQEAEELLREVVSSAKKSLDEQDPTLLNALKNLAVVQMNRGNYQDALAIYLECYEKSLAKVGENHPDSVLMMINLAISYSGLGQYAMADSFYAKALTIGATVMGLDHPTYAQYLGPRCANFRARLAAAVEPLLPLETSLSPEQHPHVLVKGPTVYEGGAYGCDVCGQTGYGLAYRCAHCGYDVHPHCAVENFWELIDQFQQQQQQSEQEQAESQQQQSVQDQPEPDNNEWDQEQERGIQQKEEEHSPGIKWKKQKKPRKGEKKHKKDKKRRKHL